MVGWQGAVKVVDFGIAKAIEGSIVSRSGSLKGKVSYMSPEQVHGQRLDGRSDLFAVGIVLYELLTGSRLFVGKSDAETLSLLLTKPFPRVREVNHEVSEELDRVVMRLLQRDRDQRYGNALEAVEDLAACSSPRARLDLESLLVARFPERAPSRGRRSSVPPVAGRPIDAIGPTLEAVPREALAQAPPSQAVRRTAETVKGKGRARPAIPSRTLTAADSSGALSTGVTSGGQGVPAGWVADTVAEYQPAASKRWLWLGGALIAFAAVVGVALLAGDDAASNGAEGAANAPVPALDAAAAQTVGHIADAATGLEAKVAVQDAGLPSAADNQADSQHSPDAALKGADSQEAEDDERRVTLTVKVVPWAEIELDGSPKGQTPQAFKLRPGKHKLRLRNSELKAERTIRFRLKRGKNKTIRLNWEKKPPR
jgi:serine/threonine-protein kinase